MDASESSSSHFGGSSSPIYFNDINQCKSTSARHHTILICWNVTATAWCCSWSLKRSHHGKAMDWRAQSSRSSNEPLRIRYDRFAFFQHAPRPMIAHDFSYNSSCNSLSVTSFELGRLFAVRPESSCRTLSIKLDTKTQTKIPDLTFKCVRIVRNEYAVATPRSETAIPRHTAIMNMTSLTLIMVLLLHTFLLGLLWKLVRKLTSITSQSIRTRACCKVFCYPKTAHNCQHDKQAANTIRLCMESNNTVARNTVTYSKANAALESASNTVQALQTIEYQNMHQEDTIKSKLSLLPDKMNEISREKTNAMLYVLDKSWKKAWVPQTTTTQYQNWTAMDNWSVEFRTSSMRTRTISQPSRSSIITDMVALTVSKVSGLQVTTFWPPLHRNLWSSGPHLMVYK